MITEIENWMMKYIVRSTSFGRIGFADFLQGN